MQKPPPNNEEIANNLSEVYRKHFHGYPETKGKEGDAILNAIAALGRPRDIQDLLNDLENQRHVMKAAGWSGIAELMLDAARRLHNFCQAGHSRHLQGYSLPLSDENLAKEIIRYTEHLRIDRESDMGRAFHEAAKRLSNYNKETENESYKLGNIADIPNVLRDVSRSANLAQITFLDGEQSTSREHAKKAARLLRAVLRALQIDDAARSLVDG